MSAHRNLAPDAFAGTAEAYVRFRPPYPRALLAALLAEARVGPGARLLDLASGPGRIALDLAAAFARVAAVDLEPEMIAVGMAEAHRRGVANIDWSVGRAEAFEALEASFDLVTIGEAFHRLEQDLMARRAMAWLKPGGVLATLGARGPLGGPEPWQRQASEIARRWMARAFPEGWADARPGAQLGAEGSAGVLSRAGFVDVAIREFEEARTWRIDEIVGWFESTSVCSRRALGPHFEAFEADLRSDLAALEPSGAFPETYRASFTLGRKPG